MEKLKDNLPIVSLILVLLGTSKTIFYYSLFNIDIISYLDFTEVLQLQYLFLSVVIGLILAFANQLLKPLQDLYYWFYTGAKKEQKKELNEENIRSKKIKSKIFGLNRAVLHADLSLLSIAVFVCVILMGISVTYDFMPMIRRKSQYEISMMIDGKLYKSDSINFYIGRTKNYIFFHNFMTNESSVFSNSDVKSLKFKPGVQYYQYKIK